MILFKLMLLLLLLSSCEKIQQLFEKPSPIFWGFAIEGYPITNEMIEQVKKETTLNPQIVLFYLQWPSAPTSFESPIQSLETIWQSGALPCLTWEPMYYLNGREMMVPYEEILNGTYDSYIDAFANAISHWPHLLIIRFAHEMNLSRYHWGTARENYGPESPKVYIEMYQYVVERFKKGNAKNILWAFCPNADSVPNSSEAHTYAWNQAKSYYPGDAYVDILGMDGYNCIGDETATEVSCPLRSFEQIFKSLYEELRRISTDKPIFVFETASINSNNLRLPWIIEALKTIQKWHLKGLIWFQANKEKDWRIQSGKDSFIPLIQAHISKESVQEWAKNQELMDLR